MLGSVELVDGNSRSAIAVVHALVQNQGDAWAVTSAYLDRFVDEQRVLAAREHSGESEEQVPYLRYMSQMGKRAAEMHLALAASSAFEDFSPQPIRSADVQRWIEETAARVERLFDTLKQQRDKISEADRPLVDQTLAQRAALLDRLKALLPLDTSGLNIRHHGDFNLGRMLIVKDDIFITGFEGDPRRPLEERRRKAPAARDVAGLIRSIDYSVTAALGRALNLAPDEHGRLAAALTEWVDRSTAAFLAAYREVMTNSPLWPADPQAAGRMLEFFMLEQMLNELEYELAQRPEWLRVPLTGVLRSLSHCQDEAS